MPFALQGLRETAIRSRSPYSWLHRSIAATGSQRGAIGVVCVKEGDA